MFKKVFLSLLFLFFCVSTVWSQEEIRITNGEWPPYLSKKLKYYGLASQIVSRAFAMEGVTVKYGFFPWKRSYQLAKAGSWDGAAVWFHSAEREEAFFISKPVIDVQYVFFHLKNYSFDWKGIDDLKNIKIGATLEYNYGELFEAAEKEKKIRVYRIPKDEHNFAKLLKGKIHIFPLDLDVGYNMLQKNFSPKQIEQLTYHPKPIRAEPLYLLLTKKVEKNKRLIKLFNNGLKRLKESGKLDEYIAASRRGDYKNK